MSAATSTAGSQIGARAPKDGETLGASESHATNKHTRRNARSRRAESVWGTIEGEHATNEYGSDEIVSGEHETATGTNDEHVGGEHASDLHQPDGAATDRQRDWRIIDRALRTIAARRAALDAEEARWLREAEALQIWRPLGMVNAIDYMERVLGYRPRSAEERLRVARTLGSLPELEQALATGELPFSAVRELTRVATRQTEPAWIREARGKSVHEIEQLVAGHRPGDTPDAPPDPTARTHVVRLELTTEAYALFRQGSAVLRDEHGRQLDDSDLITAAFTRVLEAPRRSTFAAPTWAHST